MISWRSLEFRLAAWYCVLLMAGVGAIGIVLWLGVNYAMVAAVDDLLAARVDRLADFIDSEFPSELSDAAEAGELVGLIEDVDPENGGSCSAERESRSRRRQFLRLIPPGRSTFKLASTSRSKPSRLPA